MFIDPFTNEEIVFEHGETGDGSLSSLPFQVGFFIVYFLFYIYIYSGIVVFLDSLFWICCCFEVLFCCLSNGSHALLHVRLLPVFSFFTAPPKSFVGDSVGFTMAKD